MHPRLGARTRKKASPWAVCGRLGMKNILSPALGREIPQDFLTETRQCRVIDSAPVRVTQGISMTRQGKSSKCSRPTQSPLYSALLRVGRESQGKSRDMSLSTPRRPWCVSVPILHGDGLLGALPVDGEAYTTLAVIAQDSALVRETIHRQVPVPCGVRD